MLLLLRKLYNNCLNDLTKSTFLLMKHTPVHLPNANRFCHTNTGHHQLHCVEIGRKNQILTGYNEGKGLSPILH